MQKNNQKGAALIIVLLLVATLSVIALSLTDQTIVAAARARNEAARTQMFWRLQGAETLAISLLSETLRTASVMSLDDPWAVQPFDLSVLAENESERGEIQFADATRCFNLNSLDVEPATTGQLVSEIELNDGTQTGTRFDQLSLPEQRLEEFVLVLSAIGVAATDARDLGSVIRDWIDRDGDPVPGGAEDSTYLRLPVPYRTGNTLLSDESELRAMIGVDPTFLTAIAPLICVLPNSEPSVVNINMLRAQDAPVLVGVFEDAINLGDAEALIERRPLGGYQNIDEVLRSNVLAGKPYNQTRVAQRLEVRSNYLNARMTLEFGTTYLEIYMLFQTGTGSQLELVSRRIGSDV